jgi:glycosyltransferase involved in cell wall biosynthesis
MSKNKKKKESYQKMTSSSQKRSIPINIPNLNAKQIIDICLVMIVKDEEDTMERCLKAVSPYIKYWVIVDTGSKDNTKEVITKTMTELGIPGELHERPWVNFEVNRTESLELAKGKCDYRWIIDADDTFNVENPNVNPFGGLDKEPDCYQLLYKLNALQYHRAQLVRSDQNWVYKGVLHEYLHLEGKENINQGIVPNSYVIADISPLKRASSLEEKYANDAKILEEALVKEPENTRYQFYLAQSYRDSEQLAKAVEAYQKRIEMGGWEEEVYYSMYMVAKIKEKMGDSSDEEIISLYSKAWEYRPNRLECVFHVMRKLRSQNRFLLSFSYGEVAIKTKGTSDILFLEPEIWQWRLLDEYSLAAYYIGNPEIALEKTNSIVNSSFFNSLHPEEKARLNKNIEFYKKGAEEKTRKLREMQILQTAKR